MLYIEITPWGTFCWLHQATQLWCWSETLGIFHDNWLEEQFFWSSLEDVSSSSGRVKSCSISRKEDVKLLRQENFQILSNTKHLFPNLPVLLCLGNMASWQSSPPSCLRTLTVCWTFAPPDERSVEPFGDCGDPRRISFWAVFRCQEKCSWNKKVNKCVVMLSENWNGTVMHTALCHKHVMQAIMMIWYWLSWYMDPWGRGTVSLCQAETLVHFLSLSLFCLDSFQLLHCWGIVTGGNYASSWFGGTMTDALSLCCNLTFNLGKLKNPAWWQVE